MIRLANRNELEQVNEIRRQVNEVHVQGKPETFRPDFTQELQNLIYAKWESSASDVIVAVRDDIICGFAIVEYIEKPLSPYSLGRRFYRIAEFGVDENHRRQKVATELFAFIKNHAARKGFHKIELDVWEFNQSAIHFYESVDLSTYRRYMECDI